MTTKDEFIKFLQLQGVGATDDIIIDYLLSFEFVDGEEQELEELLNIYFPGVKCGAPLMKLLQKRSQPTTANPTANPTASFQNILKTLKISETKPEPVVEIETPQHLPTLSEMFPLISSEDLITILEYTKNDVEKAVQIILLEEGEGKLLFPKRRGDEEVDFRLKERLIQRYGFVDKSTDFKEYRPILPKEEPKKMVRYREGQVVSTKGEKFTEVAINKEGEEVKIRSYLSKSQRLLLEGGGQLD